MANEFGLFEVEDGMDFLVEIVIRSSSRSKDPEPFMKWLVLTAGRLYFDCKAIALRTFLAEICAKYYAGVSDPDLFLSWVLKNTGKLYFDYQTGREALE